ncbi:stalk domain-containing protein [Paenibacillus yanchengensis]|uniref:Stalk domain-containing protein n=1 Tax=Paenibacillus yanchengensis TaxID=2035833 RepID=A0ABW4YQV7_9BACL
MREMNMLRYSWKAILTTALLFVLLGWNGSHIVEAKSKKITAAINDKMITFTTPPYQTEGTTMVPFRSIFEALQMKVGWNKEKQQITGTSDKLNITLTLNSKNAYVNEKKVVLVQAPVITKGATMVPLRFVAETSGSLVYWDGKKQHIDIVFQENLKIFKAAYHNDTSTLKYWLEHGYAVEDTNNGLTPLLYATMGNSGDAVTLLVRKDANPDVKSSTNWTPLLWAAYHQNDVMVARLLEYGATKNFVTDASTADLKLAQTRLSNYLKNGSTKLAKKKKVNDSYLNIPLGSNKTTVKSKMKSKILIEKSNALVYNKKFINGQMGYVYYHFSNGKLTKVAYSANFDYRDATSALNEFIAQLKRLNKTYGIKFTYSEIYSSDSAKSVYEDMYDDGYERYETAIQLKDLQLFSHTNTGDYNISILLDFNDDDLVYNLFFTYE